MQALLKKILDVIINDEDRELHGGGEIKY